MIKKITNINGYRLIETSAIYRNENNVRLGIEASGVPNRRSSLNPFMLV
jgi:diketogulonate reductase-like aldo/keto reductase